MSFSTITFRLQKGRIIKLILVIIFLLLVRHFFSKRNDPIKENQKSFRSRNSRKCDKNRTDCPKLVLYWTSRFGEKDFALGFGPGGVRDCPTGRCELTTERGRLEEADAVVIHPKGVERKTWNSVVVWPTWDDFDLPEIKFSDQRWIMFTRESPLMVPDLTPFRDLFNWTMTYRTESEIWTPYGKFIGKKTHQPLPHLIDRRSKPYLAAWVVSHCRTSSQREDLVAQLRRHIRVDVFGDCGQLVCPRSDACVEKLSPLYKFYLSFENALCRGYVTEKFWDVLKKTTMIPVVLGDANYAVVAPPNSFIDARNFSSAKELGFFLQRVAEDEALYSSYHAWRTDFEVVDHDYACQLCDRLQNDPISPPKWIDRVDEFWSKEKTCRSSPRNSIFHSIEEIWPKWFVYDWKKQFDLS